MIQVPCSPSRLIVVGDFEFFTPEDIFDHWVNPELLVMWWPTVARAEPRVGGTYKFSWPDMGWILEGSFTAFERGEHLGFTWCWSHEPTTKQPLQVDIYFQPLAEGARMSVLQGSYEDSEEDQQARQANLEGWIHFGMRLAGLRSRTSE